RALERVLEQPERVVVPAEAPQNDAEVRQIAGLAQLVAPDTVDVERTLHGLERFARAAFVPAQESHAPQRIAFTRLISALPADPQRGAERAVRGVEPAQQRVDVALALVRFRELGGCLLRRQQRDQLV